jgi:hypothetical protein
VFGAHETTFFLTTKNQQQRQRQQKKNEKRESCVKNKNKQRDEANNYFAICIYVETWKNFLQVKRNRKQKKNFSFCTNKLF